MKHHPCPTETYKPGKGKPVKNQTNDKTCIIVMAETWAMVCGNSGSQEGHESRRQLMEVKSLSWLSETWEQTDREKGEDNISDGGNSMKVNVTLVK